MKYFIFCISLILSSTHFILGQSGKSLDLAYKENVPLHQEVVSGGQFIDPPANIDGHPYFESRNFATGTIAINGLSYSNVSLLYNIWQDEVVTFHPVHKYKTIINPPKVDGFIMNGASNTEFIRWEENSAYTHHNNGLYQVLEKGKTRLLAKHYKTSKPKNEAGKYSSEFVYQVEYFIDKSGTIVSISKEKKAFEFLGLDKKQLKGKIADRKLVFKTDPGSFLSFLVTTHNLLNP